MQIPCPTCHAPLLFGPQDSGQIVQCPHCGQQIAAPSVPAIQRPQVLQFHSTQPQLIQVDAAPRSEPRLRSHGWFLRSFMSMLGALVALGLCGWIGCEYAGWRVRDTLRQASQNITAASKKKTVDAKARAMPVLSRYGYLAASEDTTILRSYDYDSTEDRVIVGKAKNSKGDVHDFRIGFTVSKFGNDERWEVVAFTINGEKKK